MKLQEITGVRKSLEAVYQARFLAWGQGLDQDAFQKRELTLSATEWAKSGLRTWALVSESEQILASCETFPTGIRAASEGQMGEVIASVVVLPELRGKGYATELLNQLAPKLLTEVDFLALFSEVGPKLYGRCGFQAQPLSALTIDVNSTPESQEGNAFGAVHTLGKEEAMPKWRRSLNLMNDLILRPMENQLHWHWARSDFYAGALGKDQSQNVGLETPSGSLMIFSYDYKFGKLRILHASRSATTTDREWLALWRVAVDQAKVGGMRQVSAWWPDRLKDHASVLERELGAKIEPDLEDVPMFRLGNPKTDLGQIEVEFQCWV